MTISKTKKLVLFGTGDLAQIAHEYFTSDSQYEVVAFTVDRAYINGNVFCGLPLVPFDEVQDKYPPQSHDMFCAIVYDNMNRTRAAKCEHAKTKGYKLASYISSHSFVSSSAELGEHCFIFEDNTIQPQVIIGDNCILWSGNHVGHNSTIGANTFISSHVVVSGWCDIGVNCFLGVNSTIANNTTIGKESWVMHGAIISGDIPPNSFVKTSPSEVVPLNEPALFRALERKKK